MGLTILAVLINSNTKGIKINTGSINYVILKVIYFYEVGSAGIKIPAPEAGYRHKLWWGETPERLLTL